MTRPERYSAKPLLRLLECYVLEAIGELGAEDAANLAAMQPSLARIYGHEGSWSEIIGRTMGLAPQAKDSIAEIWKRNREAAAAQGVTPDAQQFAEVFVDANFPQE